MGTRLQIMSRWLSSPKTRINRRESPTTHDSTSMQRLSFHSRMIKLKMLLVLYVSFTHLIVSNESDDVRRMRIQQFVSDRTGQDLMCLYTYDRVQLPRNMTLNSPSSVLGQKGIERESINMTAPPMFEEHVGEKCPFGALQFDSDMVRSVNDESLLNEATLRKQRGARLVPESHNANINRIQMASTDVVSAMDFFIMATSKDNGITFEFVFRRSVAQNESMTIFRIGNEHDACVDPGFRLDVNADGILVFLFYTPFIEKKELEACYEQTFFSIGSPGEEECKLPPYLDHGNPSVHVTVSLDSSRGNNMWVTTFYISYVDSLTSKRVDCTVSVVRSVPLDYSNAARYIKGSYRLFIGNNARNSSKPLVRPRVAEQRAYKNANGHATTAEGRLRAALWARLNAIKGPRLPKLFQFSGNKQWSLNVLGLKTSPFNEDTPFAFLRNKIAAFKKQHGEQIVDFVINSLRKGTQVGKSINSALHTSSLLRNQSEPADNVTIGDFYPDANVSSMFDIFHFAVYKRSLTDNDVMNKNWKSWLVPGRPFGPLLKRVLHLRDNETSLIELTQLHSIYDDLRLELVNLTSVGTLFLYPNKVELTKDTITQFRDLSSAYQQFIYFQPDVDNLKLEERYGFRMRYFPYTTLNFRISGTTSGRKITTPTGGTIEIYLDPVNKPPRLQSSEIRIPVIKNLPLKLDLSGEDLDGANPHEGFKNNETFPHSKSQSKDFGTSIPVLGLPQFVKIVELPRYGRLYDIKNQTARTKIGRDYDLAEFDAYQIRRDMIVNRTFSSQLVYIYTVWNDSSYGDIVDEMKYQLNDGDLKTFSETGRVVFLINASDIFVQPTNVVSVVEIEEDTNALITLTDVEPLMGQLDMLSRFVIVRVPLHGRLYQFQDTVDETIGQKTNVLHVGQQILVRSEVMDGQGRLVYIPDTNYFNSFQNEDDHTLGRVDVPLDTFLYEVEDIKNHLLAANSSNNTAASAVASDLPWIRFNPLTHREIQIRVLSKQDQLEILSPTVIKAYRQGRGDPVRVPIRFDDPDFFKGEYEVVLITEDYSTVEFGHAVTDDDVLRECSNNRPCYLERSVNASYERNDHGGGDEVESRTLRYFVKGRNWNPQRLNVTGTKGALQAALGEMIFRDFHIWVWQKGHTAKIEVTIRRLKTTFDSKTSIKLYVEFLPSSTGSDVASPLGTAVSGFGHFIWICIMLGGICLFLSSASICSHGFCCCCRRARVHERQKLERERRLYEDTKVQNNVEYSALLMAIADMVFEPSMIVSSCLLRGCGGQDTEGRITQILCLFSLLSLLDTEHQGVRFVFKLLQHEFYNCENAGPTVNPDKFLEFPSPAGLSLVYYCRHVGKEWLVQLFEQVAKESNFRDVETVYESILRSVFNQIGDLPVEIIILSRAWVKSFSVSSNPKLQVSKEIEAAHFVFFCHFLGPAMWFYSNNNFELHLCQGDVKILRDAACRINSHRQYWLNNRTRNDPQGFDKYELMLQTIASSTSLPSSIETSVENNVDCTLMEMSLMNLHSLLVCHYKKIESEFAEQDDNQTQLEEYQEIAGIDSRYNIRRIKGILDSLNFPRFDASTLVAHSNSFVLQDALLWHGFSFREWNNRVSAQESEQTIDIVNLRKTKTFPSTESLLSVEIQDEVLYGILH